MHNKEERVKKVKVRARNHKVTNADRSKRSTRLSLNICHVPTYPNEREGTVQTWLGRTQCSQVACKSQCSQVPGLHLNTANRAETVQLNQSNTRSKDSQSDEYGQAVKKNISVAQIKVPKFPVCYALCRHLHHLKGHHLRKTTALANDLSSTLWSSAHFQAYIQFNSI